MCEECENDVDHIVWLLQSIENLRDFGAVIYVFSFTCLSSLCVYRGQNITEDPYVVL